MPRRRLDDDEWDEGGEDFDAPGDEGGWGEQEDDDDFGSHADEESDTVLCPYCRRPIYEGAERCPYCERYISAEDAPTPRKPWWIIIGVLLCLVVFYLWIMYG